MRRRRRRPSRSTPPTRLPADCTPFEVDDLLPRSTRAGARRAAVGIPRTTRRPGERLVGGDLLPRCEPARRHHDSPDPTPTTLRRPEATRRPAAEPAARGHADDGTAVPPPTPIRQVPGQNCRTGHSMVVQRSSAGRPFRVRPEGSPRRRSNRTAATSSCCCSGLRRPDHDGLAAAVEASQEQKITWDLAKYALAYLGAVRWSRTWQFVGIAPYADPLLLPIVALLNGLGSGAHPPTRPRRRADSARTTAIAHPSPDANQQVLWTALAIAGFVLLLVFVAGLPPAGALQLHPRPRRPGAPGDSRDPAGDVLGGQRREDLDPAAAGSAFSPVSSRRSCCIIFFASVLVAKRDLFTSAGKHFLGMDFPRARDLGPILLAWIVSVGVLVLRERTSVRRCCSSAPCW